MATVNPIGDAVHLWVNSLWAVLLLLFTLGLVLVGGLQTLQTATVLTGLPMIAVVTFLMVACVKGLRVASGKGGAESTASHVGEAIDAVVQEANPSTGRTDRSGDVTKARDADVR